MADITKCIGTECSWRARCWRWLAPDTPGHQSYADWRHGTGDATCNEFWPIDLKRETKPVT